MSKIVVLKPGEDVRLNPLHSGFAHGFGIFETMRLSNRQLEFWTAHYERLSCSAKVFNIMFDHTEEAILAAIQELVQAENFDDGIVKLSLLCEDADSCCYVYSRPLIPPAERITVRLDTKAPLNEHSLLAGHKTHNYMEAIHLLKSARKAGFSDVIRLNTAGFLAETAVANLFFIQKDRLHTPALSTGILPGVIRAEVVKAARARSIPVAEGCYPFEAVQAADAVFLTNSSVGIQSVDAIDANGSRVMFDSPHPIVEELKIALADAKKRDYFVDE